jgi:hypothetical protein
MTKTLFPRYSAWAVSTWEVSATTAQAMIDQRYVAVQRHARASEGSFRESRRRSQGGRFPAVVSGKREQVLAVLEFAEQSLIVT